MADKLSIKINIAERFYPLRIDRSEEEKIRKSAQMINNTISEYKRRYSNKDSFDFLAMTVLQFAVKYTEINSANDFEILQKDIKLINNDLEMYIQKNKKV